MTVLMTKTIGAHAVVWAANGRVYFARDLHDALPDHMQGRPLACNTPREFEALCAQMSA